MKQLFTFFCIAFALVACNKDKFETKPKLKVESLSSDVVPRNQDLRITFSFTDKEGDVDDSIYYVRTRLNQRGLYRDPKIVDLKVPNFPNQQKGEIVLTLSYRDDLTNGIPTITIPGTTNKEPDTLAIKFVLLDKGKNVSDTATANVIVERF